MFVAGSFLLLLLTRNSTNKTYYIDNGANYNANGAYYIDNGVNYNTNGAYYKDNGETIMPTEHTTKTTE